MTQQHPQQARGLGIPSSHPRRVVMKNMCIPTRQTTVTTSTAGHLIRRPSVAGKIPVAVDESALQCPAAIWKGLHLRALFLIHLQLLQIEGWGTQACRVHALCASHPACRLQDVHWLDTRIAKSQVTSPQGKCLHITWQLAQPKTPRRTTLPNMYLQLKMTSNTFLHGTASQ